MQIFFVLSFLHGYIFLVRDGSLRVYVCLCARLPALRFATCHSPHRAQNHENLEIPLLES